MKRAMRIGRSARWVTGMGMGYGLLFQLGGCNFGQITTTQTLDARDAIIQIVRGIILTPIDAAITEAINNAFDDNND